MYLVEHIGFTSSSLNRIAFAILSLGSFIEDHCCLLLFQPAVMQVGFVLLTVFTEEGYRCPSSKQKREGMAVQPTNSDPFTAVKDKKCLFKRQLFPLQRIKILSQKKNQSCKTSFQMKDSLNMLTIFNSKLMYTNFIVTIVASGRTLTFTVKFDNYYFLKNSVEGPIYTILNICNKIIRIANNSRFIYDI